MKLGKDTIIIIIASTITITTFISLVAAFLMIQHTEANEAQRRVDLEKLQYQEASKAIINEFSGKTGTGSRL